jgi:hypothetical protein
MHKNWRARAVYVHYFAVVPERHGTVGRLNIRSQLRICSPAAAGPAGWPTHRYSCDDESVHGAMT